MVKHLPANAKGMGLIPGSGKSPGEGNGNPLPYSCLENSIDRGVVWATVHEVTRVRDDFSTKPPPLFYINIRYIVYISMAQKLVLFEGVQKNVGEFYFSKVLY